MVEKIALFNHKGGVSKTTTTFNLGWMLASKGKRVILVDADPQSNLTGMVLGYTGEDEMDRFYRENQDRNIAGGLRPAFESQPTPIQPVDCVPVDGRDNLFLLPGHVRLSEYEVTLGIAQELSSTIQALKNLPGSIPYLLNETATAMGADYILIDMNPSLSSINQNILMTSDYFLVPTSPDYFSVMAIDSLSRILPSWFEWAKQAASTDILRNANYPFPIPHPKFLGTVIQKYRVRGGSPARAFQNWIDEIQRTVETKLVPVLKLNQMMLEPSTSSDHAIFTDYIIETIPDFNSLIAISQEHHTPIYALTPEQMHRQGIVLAQTITSQREFDDLFSRFADSIIAMTSHA